MGEDSEFDRLLAAARAGGDWAWREIYRTHATSLLAYLRAKGAPEPEDTLGEVFLQVVRDIGSFTGDASDFRAWLFTVARHRLLDDIRSRRRRPVSPMAEEDLRRHSPTGDAQTEAIDSLVTADLKAVLDKLSPDQRDVLLLRVLGDLKLHEVAQVLGKRQGAVQALQRRAIGALKRQIDKGGVTF